MSGRRKAVSSTGRLSAYALAVFLSSVPTAAQRPADGPPDAHLWSVEFNPANADIARRIFAHAGVDDRVTVVIGTLGDGGETLRRLREEHGVAKGSLDFVFIDHDKDAYRLFPVPGERSR